jgi:hypothetical protein
MMVALGLKLAALQGNIQCPVPKFWPHLDTGHWMLGTEC